MNRVHPNYLENWSDSLDNVNLKIGLTPWTTQIADGATITFTEMPVFLDADSDPFFEESSTKWRDRIEGERKVKRR
jgi:hypothetical protein